MHEADKSLPRLQSAYTSYQMYFTSTGFRATAATRKNRCARHGLPDAQCGATDVPTPEAGCERHRTSLVPHMTYTLPGVSLSAIKGSEDAERYRHDPRRAYQWHAPCPDRRSEERTKGKQEQRSHRPDHLLIRSL